MPLSAHEQQMIQEIRASVMRIERDTDELRKVVIQGNGRPALTERVALLEARPHPRPDRWIMRMLELLITGLVSVVTAVVVGRSAGKE